MNKREINEAYMISLRLATRFMAVASICMTFVAVTVPANAAVIGFDTFGGHQYYRLDGKPWLQQEAEAVALGGHLVTINDAAENEWLWNTFGAKISANWVRI